MSAERPIAKRFIHSTHVTRLGPNGQEDGVVVKMHMHYADGTVKPALEVIRNPKRTFYVTKKGLQDTHTEKKEWEDLTSLDEFTCANADLPREVFKALNGYYPRGHVPLRNLYSSPYLYGADVSIETLMKAAYSKAFISLDVKPSPLTVGMFDTETSMEVDNYKELIMASVTHENIVYTSVLKRNFFYKDKEGNRKPGNIADLKALAHTCLDPQKVFPNPKVQKILKGRKFELNFHVADEPIDILRWIFDKIHTHKTDFMGVWNLPFDMEIILKTCKDAGVDPAEILCEPKLPSDFKKIRFNEDPGRAADHFSRRWHWLYAPAATQWYDAMCLYSILRIVSGFEASYSLDYVLRKNEISDGKLKFKDRVPDMDDMSQADWHRYMQRNCPYEYIVYNIFDVVGLQVMEWMNNDVPGLHVLIGNTPLQNFNKQTRRSADALYFKCLDRKKVTATTSTAEDDDSVEIAKQGGAVLPPERTFNAGMRAIRESPHRETYAHAHVNDIDLSAIYPNAEMAGNICRETKLATMLRIMGRPSMDMRTYASMMISLKENSVVMGKEFYGLPGYEEMTDLFGKHQASRKAA